MDAHSRKPRRRWVLVVGAVAAALAATSASAAIALGWGWQAYVGSYTLTNAVVGLALVGSGVMIGWFRPRNAVGPVFSAAGLGHLVSAALAPLGILGISLGWPTPLTRLLAGLFLGAWGLGLPSLAMLALLLFPDGRLPSARWRPAAAYLVLGGAYGFAISMITPVDVVPGEPASRPLFAVEGLPSEVLDGIQSVMSLPAVPIVVAALVVRYARGDERVRRQLLWLLLALLGMLAINLQRWVTGDGPILLLLSTVLIPVAIAIAIIRHGLLDIRVVLSRTLLYGVLVSLVVALYAGIVAALALIVPPDADRAVAVLAAIAVALLFDPLRRLLQRLVGRALFGVRDDPARTIATTRSAAGLDGVLAEVRRGLRFPRVLLRDTEGVRADAGVEPPDPMRVPLAVDDETTLVVTLRAGERRLHPADRRALELVVPAIAAVLREQRLLADLRRARAQSIEARERERQLLHRDLHDGLGPVLTGAAMRIDAAANLVDAEPGRARETLALARRDVGAALDDVRRVVYGLRPVALDRGLASALREERGDGAPSLEVVADELPPLTPAVELAAYRVSMEAVTNARRHSTATTVTVRLTAEDGVLVVAVADDGRPPSSFEAGAGIRSIHERAEELGGTAEAGPAPDGWRVVARFPLAVAE